MGEATQRLQRLTIIWKACTIVEEGWAKAFGLTAVDVAKGI